MITYRELAEYMLCIIEEQGQTDAQSHIGTMIAHEGFDYLPEYFGGNLLMARGEIKPGSKCFYIYYSQRNGDTEYMDAAAVYFTNEDVAILACGDGQKVAVYPIQPEICITYKP